MSLWAGLCRFRLKPAGSGLCRFRLKPAGSGLCRFGLKPAGSVMILTETVLILTETVTLASGGNTLNSRWVWQSLELLMETWTRPSIDFQNLQLVWKQSRLKARSFSNQLQVLEVNFGSRTGFPSISLSSVKPIYSFDIEWTLCDTVSLGCSYLQFFRSLKPLILRDLVHDIIICCGSLYNVD